MPTQPPSRRPELAEALDLQPHPEGGWFRRTWEAGQRFRPDGYPGERPSATAIHYLLAPGEQSRWHRVRADELWLWHRGGALTLTLGGTGDRPDPAPPITLGPDVERGEQVQALVPAGTWQAAHPARDEAVLVSCVVSPGFDFDDFELLPE
ncbi:cupin domain-containing protein [Prauserella oleivorans]|uniref:Cupin domain-containing protein n=1 Tax=Prauserella oleivorans TaxID=1478153 RepID=A0ABW5WAC3_9PSEU